jgi:hypothetical protein
MSMRPLSLTALFALSLFAKCALAHDPALHELPVAKAKPTTCEQLADTERYSAELADKVLKSKCEAQEKPAPKAEKAKSDDKGDGEAG